MKVQLLPKTDINVPFFEEKLKKKNKIFALQQSSQDLLPRLT